MPMIPNVFVIMRSFLLLIKRSREFIHSFSLSFRPTLRIGRGYLPSPASGLFDNYLKDLVMTAYLGIAFPLSSSAY